MDQNLLEKSLTASLAKKGALDHISLGVVFLLLIFSNKHGGLNTKLRVTKDVK